MQRRRYTKDLLWLVVACVVASTLALQANGFWLAMDFRMQLRRGITMGAQDNGVVVLCTFKGGQFKLTSPESHGKVEHVTGNFSLEGGRLTLRDIVPGDQAPARDPKTVVLVLERVTQPGQLRFRLQEEHPTESIYGPIELDEAGNARPGQAIPDLMSHRPPPPVDSTP